MNQDAAERSRGLVVSGRLVVILLIVTGLLVLFFWWVWLPRMVVDLQGPPMRTTEPVRDEPGQGRP